MSKELYSDINSLQTPDLKARTKLYHFIGADFKIFYFLCATKQEDYERILAYTRKNLKRSLVLR
jgi:hypothetical protein